MILLFEPVVAGFVGYSVGRAARASTGYVGAVVIFVGIVLAESRVVGRPIASRCATLRRYLTERSSGR